MLYEIDFVVYGWNYLEVTQFFGRGNEQYAKETWQRYVTNHAENPFIPGVKHRRDWESRGGHSFIEIRPIRTQEKVS